MSTWSIDQAHSEVRFTVKHLMITTVTGEFTDYSATMESAAMDFSDAKLAFSAKTASVNTRNEARDAHLRSEDFFHSDVYPTMDFVSTSVTPAGEDRFDLQGTMTIRGISKPLTLAVVHEGTVIDPWGSTKAGFTITGSLNRKDFGLMWSAVTEAGGVVVSDEVKLTLSVQMQLAVVEPSQLESTN
jgi:polyisoprenoid-binding protein YceI